MGGKLNFTIIFKVLIKNKQREYFKLQFKITAKFFVYGNYS